MHQYWGILGLKFDIFSTSDRIMVLLDWQKKSMAAHLRATLLAHRAKSSDALMYCKFKVIWLLTIIE